MKKFLVKDNGEDLEVQELDADENVTEETHADDDEPTKAETLTADEVQALKKLAAVSDKIVALLSADKDAKTEDEDVDKDIDDEDEDIDDDDDTDEDEDEVLDTDCTPKRRDSKASVGAIQKKKHAKDSLEENSDVVDAWAKRYGG